LKFYLVPDFTRMYGYPLSEVIFTAMGQAFFTLSVGMGSMTIIGLDTMMAILAGLIIFPACFSYGVNPDAGQAPEQNPLLRCLHPSDYHSGDLHQGLYGHPLLSPLPFSGKKAEKENEQQKPAYKDNDIG
jgi:Na+-dependent transporters of the SNF family